MSATRTLTGARWSSAVRCVTKAQHEALGTPTDLSPPIWLEGAFARGFHVGEAWAIIQANRLENAERELEVPWGPPEYAWRGHVDLADMTERVVYEAYHSKALELREEKVLQAAGYATSLGADWRAVVVAIDATDTDQDGGFAVKPYPVNVDGLRQEVRDIQDAVAAAVERGTWNPFNRVSTTPNHPECRSCPFSNTCHAGYTPPAPAEIVGLEDTFEALAITDGDRKTATMNLKAIEERRKNLIEEISEYVPENQAVTCGSVTVKHTRVKGGVTFSLTDALKAGHSLPDELAAFTKPRNGYDKWEVGPAHE